MVGPLALGDTNRESLSTQGLVHSPDYCVEGDPNALGMSV